MNGALLPLALSFGLVLLAPRVGSAAKRLMYSGFGSFLTTDWTHIEMYDKKGKLVASAPVPEGTKKARRYDFAKKFVIEHGKPGFHVRLVFPRDTVGRNAFFVRIVPKIDEISLWKRTFGPTLTPLLTGEERPHFGSRAHKQARTPEAAYSALNHWSYMELFDEHGKLQATKTYSARGKKKDDYRHQLDTARKWLAKNGRPGWYLWVVERRYGGQETTSLFRKHEAPNEEYLWTDAWKDRLEVDRELLLTGARLEIEDLDEYHARKDREWKRDQARRRRERARLTRRVGGGR
jgi:hypothetical protein